MQRPNFHRRSRKFRKLPPLPRDDFKVIIRPHQGLPMRVLTSPTLADALIEACQRKVSGDQFLLRIKPGSNIAIVSTPDQEVAEHARKLTSIVINGRQHAVTRTLQQVMEQSAGSFTGCHRTRLQKLSREHLRVRTQNVEIIQARMLGDSKSAVITFYERLFHDTCIIKVVNSLVTRIEHDTSMQDSASKSDTRPTCVHNLTFQSAKYAAPKNQCSDMSADLGVPHAVKDM
ncbi:hypothetical protein HPB52_016872 [Rhipicephalus sanguineus]|uniref:Uncharacterized protein n=1 Tax=Rhipicephalus sanguineus TaxID=34632 RepID=A0A9D4PGF8_RHISA|nr:hypothetical protein HPB52_016872 [Rhipicephalus sanguineus]